MLPPLTPATVHALAAGKLLLFGVLGVGLWAWRKLPRRWLTLAGLTVAALAVLQVVLLWRTPTPWNRFAGDELFTTAFYQRVISDGVGHDFTYRGLPPFYPPLWFYAVGAVSSWFGLTGVGAAKLAGLLATALVPVLAWWFWRTVRRDSDAVAAGPIFPLLAAVLPFAAVDFPSVLTKPYEFLSAFAVLLWFTVVQRRLSVGVLRWREVLVFGVFPVALFATYYLWLAFVAIAALAFFPWRHPRATFRSLRGWVMLAAVTLAGSAWYWGPLAASYLRHGMENWQPAFFVASDFKFFPPVEFTPRSLWLWVGLLALIIYRRRPLVRPALQLLAAGYLWQVASFVSTIFGDAPFEAARGFTFLGEVVLAHGAAYGLAVWISSGEPAAGLAHVAAVLRERLVGAARLPSATRFFVAWLALGVSLPFGLWLDQESTITRIVELRQGSAAVAAFTRYFQEHPAESRLTTLSFLPALNASVALPQYVSHNQHYSHPAANFSQRLYYLEGLASARTPAEFARRFREENPFEPIQQLILYPNGDNYELYFWLDNYPNGGREHVVRWPKRLIAEPYFARVAGLSLAGFAAWRPR